MKKSRNSKMKKNVSLLTHVTSTSPRELGMNETSLTPVGEFSGASKNDNKPRFNESKNRRFDRLAGLNLGVIEKRKRPA